MPRRLENIAPLGRRDRRIYSIQLGKDPRTGQQRHKPLSDFGIDGGLSFWTVGYFALAAATMYFLSHVPIIGALIGYWMAPIRYVVIPGLIAYALSKFEPEGRPALGWLASWARHRCSPRTRCAGQRVRPAGRTTIFEPRVAVTSDGSLPDLPAGTVRGPGMLDFPGGIVLLDHTPGSTVAVARPATGEDPDDAVLVNLELDAGDVLQVVSTDEG